MNRPQIPSTFDRSKYDELVSRGMPAGLGDTERACIMACLNLACGGSLTDAAESPCVLLAAAAFARSLNDSNWSSTRTRADGLRDLGLALLGTSGIDGATFARRLAEGTIRRVLPIALRAVGLGKEADRCEAHGSRESARAAASAARAADSAAAYAAYSAARAAAYADSAAAYAACAAANSAARAADYAADYAAADIPLLVAARLATEILTDMHGAL
jgi:hypothetical protein